MVNEKSVKGESISGRKEDVSEHIRKDLFKEKTRPPKRLGHGLRDKRPHFKSFKSPGVK